MSLLNIKLQPAWTEAVGVDLYATVYLQNGKCEYALGTAAPAETLEGIPVDGVMHLKTSSVDKLFLRGSGTVRVTTSTI